jgi:hypothetical protein
MKYIIKGILKEDYVNKKKEQEYLDFIVNEMLSGVKITDQHSFDIPSFKSLREFVDMYGDEELDRISSNPEFFNKYGWDEVEYEDGWYYFRMDNPEDEYDINEFNLEFGYDWLNHLVTTGELRVIGGNNQLSEWEVVHQDLVMDLIVNGTIIRETPIHRVFSKHKYTNPIPRLNRGYHQIMEEIIEIYKISKEEFDVVFTEFKNKLPNYVKDKWGVELVKGKNNSMNESIIDDFIDFGKNELTLGDGFNVRLTDNNDELETLASYDMSKNEISVMSKNRAVPDIIRSIAHEMVHHKQNEMGDLKGNPEEGEDGSPWEDQANSKAGELVRMFGKEFPEIYDL